MIFMKSRKVKSILYPNGVNNFYRQFPYFLIALDNILYGNYTMRSLMICAAHPILFQKNEMSGVCSAYGERRGVYRVLVGRPEGKRLFGRPRR